MRNGRSAVHIRFNNNEKPPETVIAEFCLEAYPADLNRLGELSKKFSKLEHSVLEWTVVDGEVRYDS